MPDATVIVFVTPDSISNLEKLHHFLDEYYETAYEFDDANFGLVTKARLVSFNDPLPPPLWYNSRHNWNIGGIYVGAFEGLDEDDLVNFVKTTRWEKIEYVQFLIRSARDRENGFRLKEVTINDSIPVIGS